MTDQNNNDTNKIFISEEEKEQVNDIRVKSQQTYFNLGQLEVELRNHIKEAQKRTNEIEDAKEQLVKDHQELVDKERNLIESLRDKYGDGELNPTTGEFIPNK